MGLSCLSGHKWVRVGLSGFEQVRVGTSGFEGSNGFGEFEMLQWFLAGSNGFK